MVPTVEQHYRLHTVTRGEASRNSDRLRVEVRVYHCESHCDILPVRHEGRRDDGGSASQPPHIFFCQDH